MNQLTTQLERLYQSWLATRIPRECRPHLYNLSHQHQIVFLMEIPLERLEEQPPERSQVGPYVEACRSHLLGWLQREGDVWTQIASALPPALAGTTLTNVGDLIANVYFTDCVKCEPKKKPNGRPDSKDIKNHRDNHCAHCLREEFDLLRNAVLFITLGSLAWKTLRNRPDGGCLSPVPWPYQHLRDGEPRAKSDVTDVHGCLFECKGQFVIPLMFPGGHTNALRNSYLEYLKEGLAALIRKNIPSR
ncbi:MAG TPA: hypothetical protein VME17_16430 [Bryobacteraceae bacterium]|nr:hypothetical protein [Bryobacteraceae bacterium]